MKFKFTLIITMLAVLLIFNGCGASQPVTSNPVSQSNTTATMPKQENSLEEINMESYRSVPPTYPIEETDQDFSSFLSQIESLSADKVVKLQLEYIGGGISTVRETVDTMLITRWIDMLKRMRFSKRPGERLNGSSTVITVVIGNTEVFLGSFMGSNVIISNAALGEIENYSEIEKEFEELEKAMMAL